MYDKKHVRLIMKIVTQKKQQPKTCQQIQQEQVYLIYHWLFYVF